MGIVDAAMTTFFIITTENLNTPLAEKQRDPPKMSSPQDNYPELNTARRQLHILSNDAHLMRMFLILGPKKLKEFCSLALLFDHIPGRAAI